VETLDWFLCCSDVVILILLCYYLWYVIWLCALYLFYVLLIGGEPLWNLLFCVMLILLVDCRV